MSFNQNLTELASEQVNFALEKMLASDPANKNFIAPLAGIRIKVDCLQPVFNLAIEIQDEQITLVKVEQSEEDASENYDLQLSGTAINLLKLLTSPIDSARGLRNSGVSLNGDAGLLLELSQAAKMIEIDWQLLLSEHMGETAAVLFSRALSSGLQEVRKFQAFLSEKALEKIQSENSPLPNKTELGALKTQLRDLNYRLDRLEALASNAKKP